MGLECVNKKSREDKSGADDGEARQCQDGRSECQPCGLYVSPEGNSQAHRRGCHLRTRQPVANRSLRSIEKHVLRTGRSGLVRRRSTSKIKRSEWILTKKENSHERAY